MVVHLPKSQKQLLQQCCDEGASRESEFGSDIQARKRGGNGSQEASEETGFL